MINSRKIDTTAFVDELKEQCKPFGIIVPEENIANLVSRLIAMCDNNVEFIEQKREMFESNNGKYEINVQVYPALHKSVISVHRMSMSPGLVFSYDHRHVFKEHAKSTNIYLGKENTMKDETPVFNDRYGLAVYLCTRHSIECSSGAMEALLKNLRPYIAAELFPTENGMLIARIYDLGMECNTISISVGNEPSYDVKVEHVKEPASAQRLNMSTDSLEHAVEIFADKLNLNEIFTPSLLMMKLEDVKAGDDEEYMPNGTLNLWVSKSRVGCTTIYKVRSIDLAVEISVDDPIAKPFYFDTMFSGVKNAVNGIRAKAFFKNIASAETPIEAWNLTKAYLKEDTTLAGRFGHKNSMIEYSFEFDKADATAEFMLSIANKVKCKDCNDVHPKPMFQMSFVINDENVETIFDSIKSVMEMVK